jgi:hypothetical protein
LRSIRSSSEWRPRICGQSQAHIGRASGPKQRFLAYQLPKGRFAAVLAGQAVDLGVALARTAGFAPVPSVYKINLQGWQTFRSRGRYGRERQKPHLRSPARRTAIALASAKNFGLNWKMQSYVSFAAAWGEYCKRHGGEIPFKLAVQ